MDFIKEWEVKECLKKISEGKARGPDGIVGEQIKWGGSKLWKWVSQLMQGCFMHEVVFEEALHSWVIPVVKDGKGNLENSENYRGITISSIWANILDKLLLKKLQDRYDTNACQFGFKKGVSTGMAVQTIVELGNIFCKGKGSLFCAFVDLSKAFDKLNYANIWEKLKNIKAGVNVQKMIARMYSDQTKRVCWDGEQSADFRVDKGVRQGSPLSRFLFAIVMDDIVEIIRNLRVGCEINGVKINIIVYADDIVIMGPTRNALKKMLRILIKELKYV